MRRLLIGILVAGALAAAYAPVAWGRGGRGGGRSPFTGSWTSVDVEFDDSLQRIQISGGSAPHLQYYDYGCTLCGTDDDGQPLYPCIGLGEGSIEGNVLTGAIDLRCLGGSEKISLDGYGIELTYNSENDTLTGLSSASSGWERTGSR